MDIFTSRKSLLLFTITATSLVFLRWMSFSIDSVDEANDTMVNSANFRENQKQEQTLIKPLIQSFKNSEQHEKAKKITLEDISASSNNNKSNAADQVEPELTQDLENLSSSQQLQEQALILQEQLTSYQNELDKLKRVITENLDEEIKQSALETLTSHDSPEATQILIDIVLDYNHPYRHQVGRSLVERLKVGNHQHGLENEILNLLANDWDNELADLAYKALEENEQAYID